MKAPCTQPPPRTHVLRRPSRNILSQIVRKMFLLTVSLFRLPAPAFDRGPVAFWSSAPTRDSSLPWTPIAFYDAMAAASAPNDPTDDLHEQELPDFPDDGMHGMRARIPIDSVRCSGSVDSPGVGGRKC